MTSITQLPRAASFRRARRPEERVTLLGAEVDLVKPAEVFHFVGQRLAQGERTVVANHNLHSLFLLRRDGAMRRFYACAHIIEVDSMPLIFWAWLTGRRSRRFHRCTYLDWREAFWATAVERGWRVYFIGGRPGVFESARDAILQRWPGAVIEGRHGYFDHRPNSDENRDAVASVRAFAPHILFVGMGMPIQETWILNNLDELPACGVFPIGAAFDFEAGVQRQSPRWVGQIGLEWLVRLLSDPARLTTRYCVEPLTLVAPALADLWRRARRPGPPPGRPRWPG